MRMGLKSYMENNMAHSSVTPPVSKSPSIVTHSSIEMAVPFEVTSLLSIFTIVDFIRIRTLTGIVLDELNIIINGEF